MLYLLIFTCQVTWAHLIQKVKTSRKSPHLLCYICSPLLAKLHELISYRKWRLLEESSFVVLYLLTFTCQATWAHLIQKVKTSRKSPHLLCYICSPLLAKLHELISYRKWRLLEESSFVVLYLLIFTCQVTWAHLIRKVKTSRESPHLLCYICSSSLTKLHELISYRKWRLLGRVLICCVIFAHLYLQSYMRSSDVAIKNFL